MRSLWAVLVLGLLSTNLLGQQSAPPAPAGSSDSALEQHVRELEERIVALEGQVRMLKAAGAQPTPAQPAVAAETPAAQPQESASQAAQVPQPAAAPTAPATQAAALAAAAQQGPNL